MPSEKSTGQPTAEVFPNEVIRAAVFTRREINSGDNIVHDPHIISATKLGPGEGELEFVKNNKRFALRGDKAGELSGVNFFSNPMLGALLTCEFGEKDGVEVVKVEYPVFENMSVQRVYDFYMPVEMAAELLVKTAEMCGVSDENLRESTEWLKNNNKLKGDSPGVEFIMEKVQENIWKVESQAPIAEEPKVVEEAQEIKEEPVVTKAEDTNNAQGSEAGEDDGSTSEQKFTNEDVEAEDVDGQEGDKIISHRVKGEKGSQQESNKENKNKERIEALTARNKKQEEEIKGLKLQIKALENKKTGALSKEQQEELARMKAELAQTKADKDRVTATMMAQARELGTMAQENARLEADRKALAEKSAQLAEKLYKNENGDSKTAEKVSQAEARAKAAEARATTAESSLAKVQAELVEAKKQGGDAEKIKDLEGVIKRLSDKLVENAVAHEQERAKIGEKVIAAEAKTSLAEAGLARAEERAQKAEAALAEAEKHGNGKEKIEELQRKLSELSQQVVDKALAYEQERARAERLKSEKVQADSLIVSQKEVMDSLRAELESAKNAKGSDPEAKQKIDNLTSQKNQAVLMVRTEQARAKNAEDEVEKLKEEIKNLKDKKGGPSKVDKETINALNATLQDAAKRLGGLNEQLVLAQRDRDTAQRGQQATAAENQDLRTEKLDLQRQLREARANPRAGGVKPDYAAGVVDRGERRIIEDAAKGSEYLGMDFGRFRDLPPTLQAEVIKGWKKGVNLEFHPDAGNGGLRDAQEYNGHITDVEKYLKSRRPKT